VGRTFLPAGRGRPGSTPSVSANGTSGGVVWDLDTGTNELRAYDASNYGRELYTSAQAAGNRDALDSVVKFSVPTVANGLVFVGTADSLAEFGLLPPSGTTSTIGSESLPLVPVTGLLIRQGRPRRQTPAQHFQQAVTLTNVGREMVQGPVELVLHGLPSVVRLRCVVKPRGA
jgi:hypothetical protein